jgi:Spy/CpxP family protein refolding chaperone
MKRVTLMAVIALLAAVLIGFAAGYAIGRRPHPRQMDKVTLLGVDRAAILDSLHLTAQQRKTIEAVLNESETRAGKSIDVMFNDVRSATHDARERVRAALNENQRVKLDSILSTVVELKPRSPLPMKEMKR